MSIPDYNDFVDKHLADEARQLERLPKCSECDEPIQTEYCFEFNGKLICEHCLKEHRRDTEDYVKY